MAARVGSLNVALDLNAGGFTAGLRKADGQAKKTAASIGNSFRGVGSNLKAGVAGFTAALGLGIMATVARNALDLAGSLGEVSQQLGVTTRDLQVLRFAAGQNGVTQEELDTALQKLTVTLGKVAAGAKAPTEALNAIGISADQLKGKDTGEAFRIIADGLAKVTDRSQRALIETQLFGRAGSKLDTLLAGGSNAINELAAAAEKLGIVLSEDEIKNADETADKLDALKTVLSAQIAGTVARNADSILGLANALSTLTGEVLKFLSSKPELALGLLGAMLGGRVGGLPGAAVGAFGGAIAGGRMRQNAADANMDPAFRATELRKAQAAYVRAKATPRGGAGFGGAGGIPISAGSGGNLKAAERELRRQTELGRQAAALANQPKPRTGGGGVNVPQFLAGGGGGGRSGGRDRSAEEAERKRLDALRDANQFDQEIRRANIDILEAKQQLSTDEIERVKIAVDIKDAERAAYASQLQYEVAAGERSKVEAEALLLKYDERDAIERQTIVQEEMARAREESARVDMAALANERDLLSAQLQNATTAKKRRDLQRQILDLNYRMERAALNAVLADEQASEAAKEIARQRLAILGKLQAQDNAANESSGSPLDDYIRENSDPETQFGEAQVRALNELEDGLTGIIMGTKSVKEAFHDMATAILEDLIRIIIRQLIVKALMAAMGGGFSGGGEVGAGGGAVGMASGGFVSGPGGPTADKIPAMLSNGEFVVNAKQTRQFLPLLRAINEGEFARLAMGGLAVPRASMGERVSVSNDNDGGRRGTTNLFDLRGAVMTEDILRRINEMGAQAADWGGNLGVQRMRDLNDRTFGKALGR